LGGFCLLIGLAWPIAAPAQVSGEAGKPAQAGQPVPLLDEDEASAGSGPASGTEPDLTLEPLPGVSQSEIDEIRSTLGGEGSETAGDSADFADPDEPAKPPFRIGIVPRGDPERFVKRLQPMQEGLSDLLDRPVEILPMSTYSAMINAHTLRRIDLGFYSASAFVAADRICRCVDPLVLPMADDGTSAYYAIIVARQDSAIRAVADLEGRKIAATSADSIAGYRIQMASLISEGVEPATFFSEVEMVGSATDALLHVRDGLADAAFVWSSMTGGQASGYSRGPLAYLVGAGEIDMADLAIIWQSKPIAHAPVVVLKSLTAAERDVVRTYLLALPESDTATYDLLDVHYGGGFKAAEISDFRGVGILADVDLGPPADAGSISAGSTGAPAIPVPRNRPDPPVPVQQVPIQQVPDQQLPR
jgi:phosphonate transport system substrate-binding protein